VDYRNSTASGKAEARILPARSNPKAIIFLPGQDKTQGHDWTKSAIQSTDKTGKILPPRPYIEI
jgi:hypothetical protein